MPGRCLWKSPGWQTPGSDPLRITIATVGDGTHVPRFAGMDRDVPRRNP